MSIDSHPDATPLDEMPPWDYSTALRFSCDTLVEQAEALRACGLSEATLALVAVAECRDTYWRTAEVHPVRSTQTGISVRVPAGVVARSVRLTRRLVVETSPVAGDLLTPTRGQVIAGADDATTVVLEGDGGRFPTHAMSFADAGLPSDAPWHLTLSYDDPGDAFAGSVQLLLNTDHKRISQMIGDDPDPALVADVQGHLSFDIARQLVMHAVRDERLESSMEWADDTVGAVLEGICARTNRRSAVGCRAAYAQDPHGFETELKAQLGYMP